jgi:hypothetical protein
VEKGKKSENVPNALYIPVLFTNMKEKGNRTLGVVGVVYQ